MDKNGWTTWVRSWQYWALLVSPLLSVCSRKTWAAHPCHASILPAPCGSGLHYQSAQDTCCRGNQRSNALGFLGIPTDAAWSDASGTFFRYRKCFNTVAWTWLFLSELRCHPMLLSRDPMGQNKSFEQKMIGSDWRHTSFYPFSLLIWMWK